MKKLLVTLIASAFAVTAFAQAPKSAPAATEAKKDATPAPKADAKPAKGEKKAKGQKKGKGKGKAKSDEAKK